MKHFIILILFCLSSLQLLAHGYWLELEGSHKVDKSFTIKMYYGDYPVGERLSGKTLNKMKDIKVLVITPAGEKQSVAMTQRKDYWEGQFIPTTKGSYVIVGINEEREVQDWTKHHLGITRPVQYLKYRYDVGTQTGLSSGLFLDATLTKLSRKKYEVLLTKDGKPLPRQKLVVAEFDNGEEHYQTDKQGRVNILLENPGLYIFSVDWIDTRPGNFKGKDYETVRHRLDVSFMR